MTDKTNQNDLGFTFYLAKNGTLLIQHSGKLATTLRGKHALEFINKVQPLTFAKQQQLMARVTGNYKRGNERQAKNHPKHKR